MANRHKKVAKRSNRWLWLAMLLTGVFFASTPSHGQNTTLRAFADTVRRAYSDMVFSGIDMSVTGVDVIDIPYGMSFARFDRERSRRQILVNHRWFMNRHWSNDTNTVRRDSIRSVCRDILHGVLAHEWAHHYMGHTFEKNEVLKERNADILAGRILFENLTDEKNYTFFDPKALRRSLLMLDALPGSAASVYHLSKENRKNLIIKGYMTSWLLANRHVQNEQRLLAKLDKELTQELLDTNVATRQRTIRLSNQERSRKFKENALALARRFLGERITDFSDIERMVHHIDSTVKEKSAMNTLSDTTDVLSQIIQRKKVDNYSAEVDSVAIADLAAKNRRIDLLTITNDPDRKSLEALYNLLFFREGKPVPKNEFERLPFVKNQLRAFIKPDRPVSDTTYYELQYGSVTFAINYRRATIIDSTTKNQLVTVCQEGKKKMVSLKKINSPVNDGFRYYFTTGDDTYFIDRYYHLWTETIGAKAINNKIFLQRYTTKSFTL